MNPTNSIENDNRTRAVPLNAFARYSFSLFAQCITLDGGVQQRRSFLDPRRAGTFFLRYRNNEAILLGSWRTVAKTDAG